MHLTQGSLIDVPGVKVGHAADPLNQTGCSVVLFENGAVSAWMCAAQRPARAKPICSTQPI